MTTSKDLEQLRRQILAVLDGIERNGNIKPRTAQLRKICKAIKNDLPTFPSAVREQLQALFDDAS